MKSALLDLITTIICDSKSNLGSRHDIQQVREVDTDTEIHAEMLKKADHLRNPSNDVMIILKWVLNK